MTIQFRNNFFDGEEWIEAGPAAHSLYVMCCDYADRKETDGIVPRSILPRLALTSNPDSVVESTETLIRLGFLKPAKRGNSVQIVDFLDQNIGFSSENKAELRSKWREDKNRRKLHNEGVHTQCNPRFCPEARKLSTSGNTGGVSGGVSGGSAGASSPTSPTPTQPNPTQPDRVGEDKGWEDRQDNVGRSPDSAGAPSGSGDLRGNSDGRVYPGTSVQRADLPAALVDPNQPQLRIEPDGDADRIFVAAPLDMLDGPAPSFAADFIRAENRLAAEAMRAWGRYGEDAAGQTSAAWIVASADPDVLEEYARTYSAIAER